MNPDASGKKIAVIHDWLTGMRGGEVVLEAILELFPDADLFTLIHNRGSVSEFIENRTIHTSFVDRFPFKKTKYRHYLPFFPAAIELFNLQGYDLVVSSSHCVARGVIVPPDVPHVSFLHSPMRYVWDMYHDYFPPRGFLNRFVIPFFASRLRTWDAASADRADHYVSNSRFVASRIERYYGKKAEVAHPPCVLEDVKVPTERKPSDYYLVLSALVPYKRVDLAIEAFRGLDRKLLIAGTGPELDRLKAMAPENVSFAGRVSDEALEVLYREARGLIFPGLEDFGIVPVEAQARGCPVIAYGRGGALETIVENRTGVFFPEQTPEALREAIQHHESITYRRNDFQKNVLRFTKKNFQKGLLKVIRKSLAHHGLSTGDFPLPRI